MNFINNLNYNEKENKSNKFYDNLFKIFYCINKNTKSSLILFFLSTLSKLMQLLFFCFDSNIIIYFNNKIFTKIIKNILNITQFQQLFSKGSFKIYLIGYFIIIFITFMILSLFIFMFFRVDNKKKIPPPILYLFKSLCFISLYFLYLPTLKFYISMLICKNINNKWILVLYPNIQCFSSTHNVLFICSIIFALIHITLIYLFSILYFNPFLKSKTIEKSSKNYNFFIIILYQTCGVILYSVIDIKKNFKVIYIFLLTFSLIIFYLFNHKSEYYLSVVNKTFRIISTINLWTIICILISYV